MADSPRGRALMVLAALYVLSAISDLLKPFHLEGPTTGLVFLGTRLSGVPNAILGPLLGIFLLVYAAGIWQMRRYAIYLAYGYATYVVINLILFAAKNEQPATQGERIFGIVYTILALLFTWSTAILLTRRRAELI
jgi:hypothetical protein